MAHIYTSVLQALAGRSRTGRLERGLQGYRGGAMQDLGYELPRMHIPRTWVNKPSLWHSLDNNSSGIHRPRLRCEP
jgi:hypothetical protein